MSIQDYIHKETAGPGYYKIPFIIAMVDNSNTLIKLPYPAQDTDPAFVGPPRPGESIYGVEFMVNPRTLSNNQSKIINRTQTMTSFVEDHWGDELDTLTFQGQTATFVTGGNDLYSLKNSPGSSTQKFLASGGLTDSKIQARSLLFNYAGVSSNAYEGMGINDTEIGLTVTDRRQSVSYRQFKRLVDLFRVNGCFFDSSGMLSTRYYIMLSYGSMSFKGYFESLDITEEASNPYKFSFTITYKVESTVFSYVDKNSSNINYSAFRGVSADA